MKLNKSKQWLALLANIGVVAGIVFLAFELQQNNKQLELQSYQSWVAANLEINTALADPGVRQWWDAGGKTQLTPSFVDFLESIQSNIHTWSWDEDRGYFQDDGLTQSSSEQ